MRKVTVVQDESSHWYIIPSELTSEFHNLLEKCYEEEDGWEQYEDEFIQKFSQYRTHGDINNIQLYAMI